ncbi:low molecular weight protein-tyrosine-phosphatase [Halomonas halocynthiae]|uniref:low molecular weight protein-tyrosine-phosphatase n=1 Tax=Halomonas halocynthiae TaxID=176290 RepID=UPI0003F543C8|nr:low molecular weight protein-tyrosine-phosphatase [Halomonas halocynthiae]
MIRVLFVCLGNICRSPTAEGVFRQQLRESGLTERVEVDFCGVAGWHQGKAPDPRAQAAAAERGVDISGLRARQLNVGDFERFDYVLAMDHDNLAAIHGMCPEGSQVQKTLFLTYAGQSDMSVPDPYYGGDEGFEEVLDLIEAASRGLIGELAKRTGHRL